MISLTAIDLSSNKLNGPISSEFGNLVNLTYYLRLQGNQLEGFIYLSFIITFIFLYSLIFIGQIPPELCQLNLLIHLDLSYNHLTGINNFSIFLFFSNFINYYISKLFL